MKENVIARDRGYAIVVAAFAAAIAAVGIVAFAPLMTTVETTVQEPVPPVDRSETSSAPEPIEERGSGSIAQEQGWGVVIRIAIPVLLVAAAPLLVPTGRLGRLLRLASTVLLFAGVVVGLMSVGIFLLPAAILMLIAAVRSSGQPVDA